MLYFREKKKGIAVCGSGCGLFVFTPLSRFLIDTYGWKGSFLIKAGIALNVCMFSMLFRPLPSEPSNVHSHQCKIVESSDVSNKSSTGPRWKNLADPELLLNPVFLLYAVSNFFTSAGFNIPYIFVIDQALSLNIDPVRANLLLTTIGLANIFGRVAVGCMSDSKWVNRLYLYIFVVTLCGVGVVIEPFFVSFAALMASAFLFGLTSGKIFLFCLIRLK